jgi:pimeloyl-ACP methyl ester carboxylesterase
MKGHFMLVAGLLVATFVPAAANAQPAQPGRAAQPTVEEQTIRTDDGWTLPISYYRSSGGRETPAVILLHGRGGNRLVWRGVAQALQRAGYAVVTVDLRKHGESQPPPGTTMRVDRLLAADYQAMATFDLEAVKRFLLNEHHAERLNIRKTAIVAADDMAPVATTFAAADWARPPYPDAPTLAASTPRGQDIRALVLLSPSEGAGPANLGRSLRPLRSEIWRVAALILVGAEDRQDRGTAEKTHERLTTGAGTAKERVLLEKIDRAAARGTDLLTVRGADIEGRIVRFLDQHLKSLPDPWQNRRSRLE